MPGRSRLPPVAFVALALAVAGAPAAYAQQAPGLFVAAGPTTNSPAVTQALADRTALRARAVTINFSVLGSADAAADAGATVTLNLFDDLSFEAARDRIDRTAGGFVWVGHLIGVDMSTVTLATENGVMYGSIMSPRGLFLIKTASGGVHVISEIDQTAFPPDAPPLRADAPDAPVRDAAAEAPQQDTGATIEVMVLYTPAAAAAAGGTSAMNALIANAISTTNTSFGNSGVAPRLALVRSNQIAYTESGNIEVDLSNMTNGAGAFSGVPALRDTYGADLVTLLTNTPGAPFCGIAWQMTSFSPAFASHGYNVIEQACAVGNLSFPHELGHNMGARHDWYMDDGKTPATYAHGYVNKTARVRSIMAYNDNCAALGFFCTRVPYWSNPSAPYFGNKIGLAAGTSIACSVGNPDNPDCDADDHLVLNNAAITVANFRQSVTLRVNSLTSSATFPVPINTAVTWTASASGGTSPYTYKFYVYNGSWTLGQDWSSSNTFVWTPTVAGSYNVQVWARNAGSSSTYDAYLGTGTLTVTGPAPLSVTSLTANMLFPQPINTVVTWTASATGGTSPYTYKFYVYNGSSWALGQDWSSSNTFAWTPMLAGTYSFQVWVRNSGSAAAYDAYAAGGPATITGPPPVRVTSLMANKSFPQPINTAVTWAASATGGTSPYTYKFYVYNGSSWALGQDWSSSNTFAWTPTLAGTYSFQVWVRNSGSAATYDAYTTAGPVTITGPAPLTVTSFSANVAFPRAANTAITWTATASGGTGPYTYKFFVYNGIGWSLAQDWSSSSTFVWTPAAAGTYSLQVWVRNAGSAAIYDAWMGAGSVTITP